MSGILIDNQNSTIQASSGNLVLGNVDLSSATITLAANQISGDKIDGGTISNFASTGIDDNASANALTISSGGNVGIGSGITATDIFEIDKDTDSELTLVARNESTGTAAASFIRAINGATDGTSTVFGTLGTSFTTTGGFVQNGGILATESSLAGGLSIMTRHGSGEIRFYTASHTNLRWTINTAGDFVSNGKDIINSSSSGALTFSGGNSQTNGGNIVFYGGSHATKPSRIELIQGSTVVANVNTSFNVGRADNTAATAGLSLQTNGNISATRSGGPPLSLRRNTSTGDIALFDYAGTTVGSISVTGSATAYNTSSDYRLKENVVPLTGATQRVLQLNPVRFNFISEPNVTVDGFIAHEAQAIVPEAVHGDKDAIDENNNPIYQGIDQSKLVPLLVAAIKELEQRVSQLEGN